MANVKISALTELTTPANGDYMPIVDISEALDADKTKRIQLSSLRREKLLAARTYYVRTDGNDSNNGLINSAAGAFLTLQKAWDTVSSLDMSTYIITISVADGTYAAGLNINNAPVGNQRVVLQGNTTTPASCVISPASGVAIEVSAAAKVEIKGFKISTTDNTCIFLSSTKADVSISAIDFGAAGTGQHLRVFGYANINGNYSITGGAGYHALTSLGGIIEASSVTVTLTGTPAFIASFVEAATGSIQSWFGITFSGAATGKRYNVTTNAVIMTYGGGANYFPGDAAGSEATGGIYA